MKNKFTKYELKSAILELAIDLARSRELDDADTYSKHLSEFVVRLNNLLKIA